MREPPQRIPEAIDEGEGVAEAVRTRINSGPYNPIELAKDLMHALGEPEDLVTLAQELLNPVGHKHDVLLEEVLLHMARAAAGHTPPAAATDTRILGELLDGAAGGAGTAPSRTPTEASRYRKDKLRRAGEQLDGAERIHGEETGRAYRIGREARRMRIEAREAAREGDAGTLMRLAGSDEPTGTVARTAAEVLVRENRLSHLLAATHNPPARLKEALRGKNLTTPYNPPADISKHEPALIAVRLWQASASERPAWIHGTHPVLWVTGHDHRDPEESHRTRGEVTDERTAATISMLPYYWLQTAAGSSARSRRTLSDSLLEQLGSDAGTIALRLLPSWKSSFEDLIETSRLLN